ncbi:hypothetical protein ACLIOJ_004893, partial [Vibrio parahaemolyticus]
MKAEEDLSLHLKTKQNGQLIQIYTNNHRLRLKGQVVSSNGNNLSFLCEPNSELTKLCSGDKVSLAEVYDNGTSIIG